MLHISIMSSLCVSLTWQSAAGLEAGTCFGSNGYTNSLWHVGIPGGDSSCMERGHPACSRPGRRRVWHGAGVGSRRTGGSCMIGATRASGSATSQVSTPTCAARVPEAHVQPCGSTMTTPLLYTCPTEPDQGARHRARRLRSKRRGTAVRGFRGQGRGGAVSGVG